MQEQDIQYGYCRCGCGGKTRIAPRTSADKGWVRGQPLRYIVNHAPRKHDLSYRIDPDTGCWVWLGSRTTFGYGQGTIGGQHIVAHRFYWERERGPVPEGYDLDHLCRNRACVNPEHLEPVTHAENCRRGERAILTEDQVREIKRVPWVRGSGQVLASRYGVSNATISAIRTGRIWSDVT